MPIAGVGEGVGAFGRGVGLDAVVAKKAKGRGPDRRRTMRSGRNEQRSDPYISRACCGDLI